MVITCLHISSVFDWTIHQVSYYHIIHEGIYGSCITSTQYSWETIHSSYVIEKATVHDHSSAYIGNDVNGWQCLKVKLAILKLILLSYKCSIFSVFSFCVCCMKYVTFERVIPHQCTSLLSVQVSRLAGFLVEHCKDCDIVLDIGSGLVRMDICKLHH